MDPDFYEHLLERQDGACGICGRDPDEMARSLAVDHDHLTGMVRGLLCINCNSGLGQFKDSPDLLIRAAEYLGEGATNGNL